MTPPPKLKLPIIKISDCERYCMLTVSIVHSVSTVARTPRPRFDESTRYDACTRCSYGTCGWLASARKVDARRPRLRNFVTRLNPASGRGLVRSEQCEIQTSGDLR